MASKKKMAPHPSQVFSGKGEGSEVDKLDSALTSAFADGHKSGAMRAHRHLLEAAQRCKSNNSSLSYVGIERLAWEIHNFSKDPSL